MTLLKILRIIYICKVLEKQSIHAVVESGRTELKFSERIRLLEENGFRIVVQKGSIQYYGKIGWDKLIRVDYHGAKEVPTGTCHAILKAAGIPRS